ncbi:WD repeat-containing protein on Y chromosome isoform X1 [Anabrus simplex]
MHYHFHQDINDPSYLITGDTGGNVRILVFSSKGKGPFYHKPGVDLIHIRYEGLARGELPGLKVLEFRNIHTDWVRQVSYYSSLKTFMSCSPCPDRSLYMSDVMGTKMQYKYNVSKGVTCFSVAEESHIIVTGGPDCMVRVWNVFVSSKASCVFQGHHAAIVSIVLQEAGQRIYSLSKDKCIKVWDVAAQACIQTYTGLPPELGERTPLTTLYNPINRNFIVASLRIAIVVLGATVDERTDGFTHTKAVTMALYNKLFKCVVTVGMDSSIMVWDPWNGKRMFLVKDAHIRMSYGEPKPVEITAATFDPSQQLLLTGARDGSLKVWNFNTGTCLRNMNIEQNCEVTCVIWLRNRILAVGWNRHVTEFADKGKITYGKSWDVHHTDDVLCAAYRANQALASSSYKGELVFWQLETGHAYARYNVASPHDRLQLSFKKERSPSVSRPSLSQRTGHKPSFSVKMTESTSSSSIKRKSFEKKPSVDKGIREPKEKKTRRLSVIQLPADGTASGTRSLSVHAMVFLETRPMQANVGSLLLSLETGVIQLWSHHSAGGYLGQYLAVHMSGDYVVSMATDPQNEFLFTGTTMGYMKIWLMKNYGIPEPEHICMPLYRLQFPFLWKDRIEGRAKRCIRDQKWPLLLSSYKGHLLSINHIEYLTACKVLITSSSDTTVRMWTLGGLYLGTLGSYRPWNPLKSDAEPRDFEVRLPPEIKRIASSTTFKVLMGGDVHVGRQKVREEKDEFKELPRHVIKQMVYGERLKKPYLGHFFKLPPRKPAPPIPKLDSSMQYVPVYCHLKIPELEEIKRPQTPEKLAKMMRFKTKPQTRAHTDGAQGGRTSGRHRRGSSKESKKRTGSSRGPSASTEEAGKKRTVSLDVK